eukprot:SAG11_NODE_738_length_7426_cov_14.966289_5_plen_227_part_00
MGDTSHSHPCGLRAAPTHRLRWCAARTFAGLRPPRRFCSTPAPPTAPRWRGAWSSRTCGCGSARSGSLRACTATTSRVRTAGARGSDGGRCRRIRSPSPCGRSYRPLFDRLAALPHLARLDTPYFPELETPRHIGDRAMAAAAAAAAALVRLRRARVSARAEEGDGVLEPVLEPEPAALLLTHSTVLESLLASHFGMRFESVHTSNLSHLVGRPLAAVCTCCSGSW